MRCTNAFRITLMRARIRFAEVGRFSWNQATELAVPSYRLWLTGRPRPWRWSSRWVAAGRRQN